ncbi:MAG: transcription elongation factor GreAB [Sulfurimonas sp.]|nr:MAG: transcription elongation factor GreAB [Sulfurimonas sp.]
MERYDEWNEIKKHTQKKEFTFTIKSREIYWVKIGQNIGSEEYGKDKDFTRPVIIIRKLTKDLFIGIPLTTTPKDNDYFHKFIYNNRTRGQIENSAMILQLRTFSIKRVLNKIGKTNQEDFEQIVKKMQLIVTPPK